MLALVRLRNWSDRFTLVRRLPFSAGTTFVYLVYLLCVWPQPQTETHHDASAVYYVRQASSRRRSEVSSRLLLGDDPLVDRLSAPSHRRRETGLTPIE